MEGGPGCRPAAPGMGSWWSCPVGLGGLQAQKFHFVRQLIWMRFWGLTDTYQRMMYKSDSVLICTSKQGVHLDKERLDLVCGEQQAGRLRGGAGESGQEVQEVEGLVLWAPDLRNGRPSGALAEEWLAVVSWDPM